MLSWQREERHIWNELIFIKMGIFNVLSTFLRQNLKIHLYVLILYLPSLQVTKTMFPLSTRTGRTDVHGDVTTVCKKHLFFWSSCTPSILYIPASYSESAVVLPAYLIVWKHKFWCHYRYAEIIFFTATFHSNNNT